MTAMSTSVACWGVLGQGLRQGHLCSSVSAAVCNRDAGAPCRVFQMRVLGACADLGWALFFWPWEVKGPSGQILGPCSWLCTWRGAQDMLALY